MANLHQRRIAGALCYWDTHQRRLIDAFGANVVKYLEDFIASGVEDADHPVGWTVTLVEGGGGESTIAAADAAVGGALLLTTDASENDGINMQLEGRSFQLSTTQKALYFGTRFKADEATQNDFLIGLAVATTDALGGVTDGVYFRKVDGSTSVAAVTETGSSETATAGVLTFAADTNYILELYFDGTSVEFFVDGVSVAKHTLTIPTVETLSPVVHFLAGSANARTLTLDWLRVIQIGR